METSLSLSLSPCIYIYIYICIYGVSLSCIFRRDPAVGVGAPDGAYRPERGRQEIRLMIIISNMIIIMIMCSSSSSDVITIISNMCTYMRGRQEMYEL